MPRTSMRVLVDVEELIRWAYEDQKVDIIEGRGVGLHELEARADGIFRAGVSGDGIMAMQRRGVLGCRVDGGGFASGDVHPDALAVHQFVIRLGAWGISLMQHGRRGMRPGFIDEDPGRFEPVWRGDPRYGNDGHPLKGAYRMLFDENRNAIGCKVEWLGNARHYVQAMRVEYREWWQGLKSVAEHFQRVPDLLERYGVTGPAAEEAPWVARPGASKFGAGGTRNVDVTKNS